MRLLTIAKPLKSSLLQLQSPPCPALCCYKSVVPDWLPEKPKRPATAYIAWIKDNHSSVRQQMPQAHPKEVIKHCSQQYKSISETEKEKYKNRQSVLLQEYKLQLDHYLQQIENLSGQQKSQYQAMLQDAADKKEKRKTTGGRNKLKKMLEELGKPKRAKTAFALFMKEHVQIQNKKDSASGKKRSYINEVMPDGAKKWSSMSEPEKSRYTSQSEAAKLQYKRDLDKWEADMKQKGLNLLIGLNIKTLNHKSIKDVMDLIEPVLNK